jgi:phenylalanyl-tRNA synthetase beta chain
MGLKEVLKDKIAGFLVGQGYFEIFTNSITNSKYFDEATLGVTVKMMNSLSAELDVLRPSMIETGLESIAYNLNRKNNHLRFFEYGKTYKTEAIGSYQEQEHLCLYTTGLDHEESWRAKSKPQDFYGLKGLASALLAICGLESIQFLKTGESGLSLELYHGKLCVGSLIEVNKHKLQSFDIKQPVFVLDIYLGTLLKAVEKNKISYKEVNKFPIMQRDLAMVVSRATTYESIESSVKKIKLSKLKDMRLFDVFESDKLGTDKKSMAVSFLFADEEKTLTDKEVDGMVAKLIQGFENDLMAEIRK